MDSLDEDITTFAGFGSWMSTFTPGPSQMGGVDREPRPEPIEHMHELDTESRRNVQELPTKVIDGELHFMAELPSNEEVTKDSFKQLPASVPKLSPVKVIPKPKPIFKPMPDPMTRVEVRGLQKLGQKKTFTDVLHVSTYSFLADLAEVLESRGYRAPVGFSSLSNAGCFLPLFVPAGVNEGGWPIVITTDKSCYDPDIGLRIHIDEPFTVFLSHLRMSVKCANSRLLINDGDLNIAFHRTLRVPEDGGVHMLPASLGRFPVQSLAAYSQKLRASKNESLIDMANKSGVFFPIFQREAMWISFSTPAGTEYKIRIFAGGINIVTGNKWDERKSKYDSAQNYILVPPQEHLDGIAVDDGIVRQFVAMPIGSGYSIEKQLTGREDIGGLQIEITPKTANMDLMDGGTQIYPETKDGEEAVTPRSYGLSLGHEIELMRYGKNEGPIFLGGKLRRHQKRTLRQLIYLHAQRSFVVKEAIITALYNVKLQIKLPGTLRAHKIETPEFSPFTTMSDVALNTTYRDATLKDYTFWYGDRLIASNDTITQAGLTSSSLLIAKPKRAQAMTVHGPRLHDRPGMSSNGYGGVGRPPPGAVCVALPAEGTACVAAEYGNCQKSYSTAPPSTPAAIKPKESWAMGVATGGFLKQQIFVDTDIHRTLATNNGVTTLISVQLLNSVIYEAVTGMVCLRTPITPKTYLEKGLPWFDTYNGSASLAQGSKEFGRVKSVSEIDDSTAIEEGTDISQARNVACTVCRISLCDCLLRPCKHTFCASCVTRKMLVGNKIRCWECRNVVQQVLGFSAPMALPGKEEELPDLDKLVVVKAGKFGNAVSAYELE